MCLTFWGTATVFQSSCSILHSYQQCMRISVSVVIICLLYYSYSTILMNDILWFWFAFPQWLMMLSIFSCAYFTTCVTSSVKCLFTSFAHFKIRLSFYCWLLRVLYILWIQVLYQINARKELLSACGFVFSLYVCL